VTFFASSLLTDLPLRDYQADAVSAILEAFDNDRNRVLLVMPTGTGKTHVFLQVAVNMARLEKRTLIVSHRREILLQTLERAQATGLRAIMDSGPRKAPEWTLDDVVVTTVQTMSRGARHARYDEGHFDLIIFDEAHHSVAPSYQRITEYFNAPHLLGATATPHRHDKVALGNIFDTVAYEMSAMRAINQGWLVPVLAKSILVESVDLTNVPLVAGDFAPTILANVMEREKAVHGVVHPLLALAGDRPTLVFASSVNHAKLLAQTINNKRPGAARIVTGETPLEERDAMMKQFRNSEFQFLVNCQVATEGFDAPNIRCVAVARPTRSVALLTQMIGRGLRPLPGVVDAVETEEARRQAIAASNKPNCLILDFYGTLGKRTIATVADALAGTPKSLRPAIIAAATNTDEPKNLDEIVRDAHSKYYELDAELRKRIKAKVKWKTARTSPFKLFDLPAETSIKAIAVSQIHPYHAAILSRNGIPTNGLSANEAALICDYLRWRRQNGLCTYKQAKVLVPRGFHPNISFEMASQIMDDLIRNGFRWTRYRPHRVKPKAETPARFKHLD